MLKTYLKISLLCFFIIFSKKLKFFIKIAKYFMKVVTIDYINIKNTKKILYNEKEVINEKSKNDEKVC